MISVKDLKHTITEEQASQHEQSRSNATSRAPSPNRGASVPDNQAIGADSQSKPDWLREQGIDVSKQVKISKLSHMRYQHPDLQEITKFLKDFGMHVVKKTSTQRWYRGYGPDQYVYYAQQGPKKYLGGTFELQSYAELEKVLLIPDVKIVTDGIETMHDAPGGGFIVTIEDPEGFLLNFVFGQDIVERGQKVKEKLVWNDELDKPRQKAFQRFQPGPAEVYKLGHFGLNVQNFASQMKWYTTNFNLLPSDILYIPSQSQPQQRIPVALFAHINLAQTPTDHHSLFLTSLSPPTPTNPTPAPHIHHSSFEVHDLDTQFLGHAHLATQGYESVWGVGRHILGSQIFDYWWDTSGFMVEHYADGDLVDESTRVSFGPAGHEGLAVWGPEVPGAFLE